MPDSAQPNQRKTVLFVDDEPLFLEMIELLAREQGSSWEVIVASTAQRALELLKEQTVDLAVIDLRMPVIDGLQLVEIMQQQHPQLLKVVLTGFATDDSKTACLKGGANFFLEKPKSVEGVKSIFATLQELVSIQPAKGFRGMLVRVDLPEVIQMECLSRHSSILEVITDPLRGEIYIKDGSIIHAHANQQQGESAFQQLLQLSGGEFKLKTYSEPPAITIQGAWEFLLMEAMRQRDEAVNAREQTSPMTAVPPPIHETPPQPVPPAPPPITTRAQQPDTDANHAPVSISPAPLPPAAAAPNRLDNETRTPSARIEETLVCSPQGEVLHEWQCASVEQRLQLLNLISDTVARLSQDLQVGPFKRLEIDSDQGRLVVVVQNGNRILVRSRRGGSWDH